MGVPQSRGSGAKKKMFKRAHKTKARLMDIDQVYDDLQTGMIQDSRKYSTTHKDSKVFDEDLPGGGLFYCQETARHFIDAKGLAEHKKTKAYKKRVKELRKGKPYGHKDADEAGGLMPEIRRSAADIRARAAALAATPVEASS